MATIKAFTGTSKAKTTSTTQDITYSEYPDSGVRYAGYYKKLDGSRTVLFKQIKAYYSAEYTDGEMNPIETILRSSGSTTRFYLTHLHIQYIFIGNYKNTVQLIDRTTVVGGVNDVEKFKFNMWYGNVTADKQNITFDFSDNPLEFLGTRIGILAAFALTAGELFIITLSGFEEFI